jgi:hypothetical protein
MFIPTKEYPARDTVPLRIAHKIIHPKDDEKI